MHPLHILSETVIWAGKNLAYNLGFIPDDKLDWKPAPSAKSAFEICSEVVGVAHSIPRVLRGEDVHMERPTFASREEAQAAVERATQDYADFLATLSPDDLQGDVQFPFGPMARETVARIPVMDAVHHHGQIAYIQTLLGDTQSHFFEMGS